MFNTIKTLPRWSANQFNPKDKRCEEPVSPLTYQMGRGRNKKHVRKCACFAKFELNGKFLCVRHAQQEALKLLLIEAGVRRA